VKVLHLDGDATVVLRRMQGWGRATGIALVELLLTGGIKEWEQLVTDSAVCASFRQGMSLHLAEARFKQEVCKGRASAIPAKTAHRAYVLLTITCLVQYTTWQWQ
jgi:hypothetical protein